MNYTTQDSIKVERELLRQGIVKQCQHKHKFSDVTEVDEDEDFCFVCMELISKNQTKG